MPLPPETPARRTLRAAALATLTALLPLAPAAVAQDAEAPPASDVEERVDSLEKQIQELREQAEALRRQLDEARYGATHAEDEFYIPRLSSDFESSGQPDQFGGIYTKPFLANLGDRTYIGGYLDLEYSDPSGSGSKEFDQHRFVPFFYSDVSDRVKLSAEIEFEHGHELEVEFAQVDYLFNPAFNLRAGIQLLPLGKFNEVHDSPIQDLTFRPLVDTYIIPTTLRDAGLGAYGAIGDEVSYNVTLTNGFRGLDAGGVNVITATDGLDDAAPHEDGIGEEFENINDELAWTGRVAWTPTLGFEVGASAHLDTYDELGDNDLHIYALDATLDGKAVGWLPDAMELLAEAARANIERDAFAQAAVDGDDNPSPVAGDMQGYYVQANYHLFPGFLERWKADGTVEEGAHFTFVTRYDDVRLDTYNRERITLGLNFRPNAHDTVFKLDYQINDDSGSAEGTNDDDAVVFSVATYF